MSSLYQSWLDAKEAERVAVENRRSIEDQMVKEFQISEQLDGTKNFDRDGYKVKVVGRINRKVDSDLLQEVAAEAGLSDHLSSLFRWKPEINQKAWDNASEAITKPLTAAITATPGRPSFSITKE